MAQKVITLISSDLSGAEGAAEYSFALDGVEYAIDLTAKEKDELDKALARFIEAGRKVGARGRKAAKSASGTSAAEVRAWGKENGYSVPDRGRIPAEVREAFEATN
ncbi:histone-like nucleoid-structuring protein Lsr2 [Nocardioides sp. Root140]|uniref:histone-like nucleoid-structuring protein Lsr2 n=1 Tax=Nocardioides sp. Root140 TaxID=1736460 RepID=UPI0006F2DF21|nr:Lsr2 family protein [Nocardioides sp. Root140]KQY61825.1 hypothetical protein ASD30_25115 [Nocardioides sp. Root140]